MLRQVRCRDEQLRKGDRVVRKEEHLKVLLCIRVGIDDTRNIHDESDGELRDVVSRSGLAGKEDDARVDLLPLLGSHGFQSQVTLRNVR